MYSLQALWSQAREDLKVITIICANQEYAILKVSAYALPPPHLYISYLAGAHGGGSSQVLAQSTVIVLIFVKSIQWGNP